MFLSKSYYKTNFQLAFPIILASMGQSFVQMVDTIMVGHLGTTELAAVAFAGSVFASNEIVVDNIIAKSENQPSVVSSEENTAEDKRECLTFTQTIKRIDNTTTTVTRTVCSYHHTEKEIEEAIEKLEGIEIN